MLPLLHLGPLAVPTYYLLISIGVTFAVDWFVKRAVAAEMPRVFAIDLALVILVSGFLGARLLHIFFEEPEYYAASPWRALLFWRGGFVYFGGFLTAIAAAFAFCAFKKQPFWVWADLATPPCSLAYAVGRFGCFLNGCCYGKACRLPWAVPLGDDWRHPTQIYASLWEVLTLTFLLSLAGRKTSRVPGRIFSLWLILHGVGRAIMEQFRDDSRGPLLRGESLGSWISLGLVLLGLVVALDVYKRTPAKEINR